MDTTSRYLDYARLDEVAGTDGNPKGHDLPAVVRSIAALGFTSPAVLDERTGQLIIGNGRLAALRIIRDYVNGDEVPDRFESVFTEKPVKDGITAEGGAARPPNGIRVDIDGSWLVPIIRGWESRDDDQARAAVIADNQLTMRGGWDDRALAEWLDDLADTDPDLFDVTGFTREDLDDLLATFAPPPDLDDLADEYGDPVDSDLWPIIRVKVPPHIRNAFRDLTANAGSDEDSARFIHLVELMQDAEGA